MTYDQLLEWARGVVERDKIDEHRYHVTDAGVLARAILEILEPPSECVYPGAEPKPSVPRMHGPMVLTCFGEFSPDEARAIGADFIKTAFAAEKLG